MKHFLVFLFTFFIFSGRVAAQDANEYFVVVETNIYKRDYSIVKIYDNQNQLVYEEYLNGIYIDIKRKKYSKLIQKVQKRFNTFKKEKLAKGQFEGFIKDMLHIKA